MSGSHVPASDWHIATCDECDEILRSPFPPRPEQHDPDGFGTFCYEIANELGVDSDEITTNDMARAWCRAMGWRETSDAWVCAKHKETP